MTYDAIDAVRKLIISTERRSQQASVLFSYEKEFYDSPNGISIIIPVHNGATEMEDLFLSLRNQSLSRSDFEIIFALNGCHDNSRSLIDTFATTSGIQTVIIESDIPCVAKARNKALQHARFRYTTFVDHDDYLSRGYLEECVRLGDYRSVIVSNIMLVRDNHPEEDYAQKVISDAFFTSYVHPPEDISICYRAYTLNAIKTAPTYMVRNVHYSEDLAHSEDVKFWRDVFHAFTPITIKTPTRRDIYYRKVLPHSLSRKNANFYHKAKPRFIIL